MPINVFGNSSSPHDTSNKTDTTLFAQKPYLRSNYIASNIEEDIFFKNRFRFKILPCLQKKIDAVCKFYVDSGVKYPSIIRNTAHVDLNDKNLDNVRFFKANSLPAVREHLTPKFYVDESISHYVKELSLLRLDSDEKLKLDQQDSLVLNSTLTSPKTIIEMPTKPYVENLHKINRKRRDLSSVVNDHDNEFDNNPTNLDGLTVIWNPILDNEVSNNKNAVDSIGGNNILKFNQTLQIFLKVSVGNDVYNLTKFERIQIEDTTNIKYPNNGGYLLQNCV